MVVVVLLSTRPAMNPELLGAVLFGGMALVFYLIYLLAAERQRFAWALAPAAALGVMGLAALAAHLAGSSPALATVQRLWPTLLIVAGAALLGYAGLRASRQTPPAVAPPAAPAAAVPPLASGASVTTVTDDAPPAKKPRYERSPITLVDEKPASQASGGVPGGEVPDIYEFLKNAPPEEGSQR
jgi:hypothetical protein